MAFSGFDDVRPNVLHPEDAAEKKYTVTGTAESFSSNASGLDVKAVQTLAKIKGMSPGAVVLHDDFLEMEPQNIPAGERIFLAKGGFGFFTDSMRHWKWKYNYGFGYGIWHKSEYIGIKRSYVYDNGDHKKTIMNVYYTIGDNTIRADDIYLCHVFQSDGNYDPRPKETRGFSDFFNTALVKSRAEKLEALINNPYAFEDFDENNGVHSTRMQKGKRSEAWKNFTEIKVLGPNGAVLLTLAICHGCSVVYKTGKGDSNNGTKTLTVHHRKCSGQHHIAGKPQAAAP